MTQQDFIFSNSYRHRLARHAAFFFACWIFFLISFYIPIKVLPGWTTENFTVNVARLGLLKWLWLRLQNSMLILIPMLVFAYSIIYFLLPRYFLNDKKQGLTLLLFAGIFILVLLLQFAGGWVVAFNWTHAGPGRKMPGVDKMIQENVSNLLFNYPIVAGFAVTIKMMKNSWLKKQETMQVSREKANAELQLLKSQVHPHFLFNTLNNIYFFTLTASQKAPEILTKLTDLLRYIINECNHQLVPLSQELKMIEDYMALERIRYGDRLMMELDISGNHTNKMIPPLLLIPLVENSFKHGASKMLERPWVNLSISIEGQWLFFLLSNSRPGEIQLSQHPVHIGLNNVKKRLQLLYPGVHDLDITETSSSFEVFMKIRLEDTHLAEKDVTAENIEYAMV
jgi:hypothetical protein